MKDRFESGRPRLTGAERDRVWARLSAKTTSAAGPGTRTEPLGPRPMRSWLTPMAVGAAATVVLAVVIWDRAPEKAQLDAVSKQSLKSRGVDVAGEPKVDGVLRLVVPDAADEASPAALSVTVDEEAQVSAGAEEVQVSAGAEEAQVSAGAEEVQVSAGAEEASGGMDGDLKDPKPRQDRAHAFGETRTSEEEQLSDEARLSEREQPAEKSQTSDQMQNSDDTRTSGKNQPSSGERPTSNEELDSDQRIEAGKRKESPAKAPPTKGEGSPSTDNSPASVLGSARDIPEDVGLKAGVIVKDGDRAPAEIDAAYRMQAGRGVEAKVESYREGMGTKSVVAPSVDRESATESTSGGPAGSPSRPEETARSGEASRLRKSLIEAEAVPLSPIESAEPYDAVTYSDYGSNPLVFPDSDPLSTFAVDVDKGSYTVARRYVTDGYLPEPASVRVEEFVNFFDPGYPSFEGPDFRLYADGADAPYGEDLQLLRVGIKARTVAPSMRPAAHLTFVVDVSGSMDREDRLGLVRASLSRLVDQLRPDDRVALVVYGTRGQVVLPGTSATNRERILEGIERLRPSGSTNAEEGLLLGYEVAREMYDAEAINRILLCSDGVANVGRTGPEAILSSVRAGADEGIFLTTVGFGMGNYNDVLMEQLADQGDGVYYYVDRMDEAERIFVRELTGTLFVVARDAKIQVEFDPRYVESYRLIGFENREVADVDFRNDSVDAGEIGSGHSVVALYEMELKDGVRDAQSVATIRFRYAKPGTAAGSRPEVMEISRKVKASEMTTSFSEASSRFRLAAVAAEYAEIVRHSFWAQGRPLTELVDPATVLAQELSGDPDVAEFARLVLKAANIQETMTDEERARRWPHLRADLPGYPNR